MKNLIFCLILIAFLQVKAQTWQWATAVPVGAVVASSCNDFAGNSYLTGYTTNTAVIGSYTINSTLSAFLVKFDPNGNIAWVKSFPNSGSSLGVCCDNTGNVFITGFFQGSMLVGTYTLSSNYPGGIFTVKYDSSGNVLWAKSAEGPLYFNSSSIATDYSGNCYITGMYTYLMSFGTYTLYTGSTSTNSGHYFIAKYDANGNFLWARTDLQGTMCLSAGVSVCTDLSGNAFITGSMKGTMVIGATTLVTNGDNDIFIAKYSPAGNLQWAYNYGGTTSDGGNAICSDPSGNIYVTGNFSSQNMVLGSNTLTNSYYLPSSTYVDIATLKLSNSGNLLLAKNYGTFGNDLPSGIAANSNYVFMVGSKDQGSMAVGNITLTSSAKQNYLIQLDNNLTPVSGMLLGGGALISLDNYCNIYYSGNMNAPFTLGTNSLTPTANPTPFMAKMIYDGFGGSINVSGNIAICTNESSTLTALGALNYTWSNGSSGSSIVITPTISATYTVWGSISSSSICLSSAVVQVSVSTCEGIAEHSPIKGIHIFPNPTSGILNVDCLMSDGSGAELEIRDGLGQSLMKKSDFDLTQSIDVSSFPKGIYFICINDYVHKFVKD